MADRDASLALVMLAVAAVAPAILAAAPASAQDVEGWWMFRRDASHQASAGEAFGDRITKAWSVPVEGAVTSSPAVVDGLVYFGSDAGRGAGSRTLYALAAGDGKLVWSNMNSTGIRSSPAVVGGRLFVGTSDGLLVASDAWSDERAWEVRLGGGGGPVLSSPAVESDTVYIGTPVGGPDHALVGVDAGDGTILWQASMAGPVVGSPAFHDGTVFAASGAPGGTGEVAAVRGGDRGGEVLWRHRMAASVTASPAVQGDTLFIQDDAGTVVALDTATGMPRWTHDAGRADPPPGELLSWTASPALAWGLVVVAVPGGPVVALDADRGDLLWEYGSRLAVDWTSPAVAGRVVYVAASDGSLRALSLDDGDEMWLYQTGGPVVASPAVVHGVVYVGTMDGTMHALKVRDSAGVLVGDQWSLQTIGVIVAVTLGGVAVAVVAGRRVLATVRRGRSGPGRPQAGAPLVVDSMTVHHGGKEAVSGISFTLPAGSLGVLLGPSGSGKSTAIKAMVGLQAFTGRVQLGDQETHADSTASRHAIGYVPQDLELYTRLTPLDNIAYFGGQYGIQGREARRRGAALLADLGLPGKEKQRVETMSGGEQRRVSIACALVHHPDFLFLDEPSSGLDFSSRTTLWNVLAALARNRGITMLATTHFLDEADAADHVGILHRGQLVAMGRPRDLVRTLPGDGRGLELEFDRFGPEERARLDAAAPELLQEHGVERLEPRAFSCRFYCKRPDEALQALPGDLARAGLAVRSSRLFDITMEDVFLFHAGASFQDGVQ